MHGYFLKLGGKYGVLCLTRRNYPTRHLEFFILELFDRGERDRELNSIVQYSVERDVTKGSFMDQGQKLMFDLQDWGAQCDGKKGL